MQMVVTPIQCHFRSEPRVKRLREEIQPPFYSDQPVQVVTPSAGRNVGTFITVGYVLHLSRVENEQA